jgi:hypothetical protein
MSAVVDVGPVDGREVGQEPEAIEEPAPEEQRGTLDGDEREYERGGTEGARGVALRTPVDHSSYAVATEAGRDDQAEADAHCEQSENDRDPYALACGHVRAQQKWADETRRATVAIGSHERIRGLNQLQATQSLFYAMTEICKGRPASFQPAETAARAVRAGKYRADLGTP